MHGLSMLAFELSCEQEGWRVQLQFIGLIYGQFILRRVSSRAYEYSQVCRGCYNGNEIV
jgi:hypothetical protein